MFSLWPMTAMPVRLTCAKNSSWLRAVRVPGTLSILSMVPPVCPRPRPLILAILTPQAAAMGAITRVVLSPTPPVECLSTLTPAMGERSTISPLWAMMSVRHHPGGHLVVGHIARHIAVDEGFELGAGVDAAVPLLCNEVVDTHKITPIPGGFVAFSIV